MCSNRDEKTFCGGIIKASLNEVILVQLLFALNPLNLDFEADDLC
jgi:hypothetical protein